MSWIASKLTLSVLTKELLRLREEIKKVKRNFDRASDDKKRLQAKADAAALAAMLAAETPEERATRLVLEEIIRKENLEAVKKRQKAVAEKDAYQKRWEQQLMAVPMAPAPKRKGRRGK
jgi:hypothetical protein